MKTNLHSMFKQDKDLEENGVWFKINEAEFLVSRFGGFNKGAVKAQLAKHQKPYAAAIKAGLLDDKQETKLYVKVFVEACVHDWKGILDENNEEIPFTQDAAIELLSDPGLDELKDLLIEYASDAQNYKEDLGNY